jgi:hypothetical protein
MGAAREGRAALRRPRFLTAGERPGPRSLGVDGALAGCAEVYSHWRDARPTPSELAGDTSAEILLRAAADPTRWLDRFDDVCNDHVDADGLLAMAIACRPEAALPHRELLIGAAEAGDFDAWPGEVSFRLTLRLHQLVRDEKAKGSGWEQRCCDAAVDHLTELIADSARPDPERDAEVALVLDAKRRIERRDGIAIDGDERLRVIRWRSRLGHAPNAFMAVHQPDDLPSWALSAALPADRCQLLAMEDEGGTTFLLDSARWSWARTTRRPTVPWPDLSLMARSLQTREPVGGCTWLALPASRRVGFVCLLASSDGGERAAPSRLGVDAVVGAIRAALA